MELLKLWGIMWKNHVKRRGRIMLKNIVKPCGFVEQCGTIWKNHVKRRGIIMWKNIEEPCGFVEQCGTIWENHVELCEKNHNSLCMFSIDRNVT